MAALPTQGSQAQYDLLSSLYHGFEDGHHSLNCHCLYSFQGGPAHANYVLRVRSQSVCTAANIMALIMTIMAQLMIMKAQASRLLHYLEHCCSAELVRVLEVPGNAAVTASDMRVREAPRGWGGGRKFTVCFNDINTSQICLRTYDVDVSQKLGSLCKILRQLETLNPVLQHARLSLRSCVATSKSVASEFSGIERVLKERGVCSIVLQIAGSSGIGRFSPFAHDSIRTEDASDKPPDIIAPMTGDLSSALIPLKGIVTNSSLSGTLQGRTAQQESNVLHSTNNKVTNSSLSGTLPGKTAQQESNVLHSTNNKDTTVHCQERCKAGLPSGGTRTAQQESKVLHSQNNKVR
ncbi:MAG: hypothetical protein FRX49_05601 [Trebouxia sp. A1-2]|nr:MAG: hypothetical protein FRX49_05601 [Trebouxia sp. A1-2]